MKLETWIRRSAKEILRDLRRSTKRRKRKTSHIWKFKNGAKITFKEARGGPLKGSDSPPMYEAPC